MKKNIVFATLVLLTMTTLALSVSLVFAGSNNQNGDNGYQGTNKYSNQLPDQSNVPEPAGVLEALLGEFLGISIDNVTDGCRAGGPDIPIYDEVLGTVDGGPCCKGPLIEEGQPGEGAYEPNQCCNPPDIIYPQDYYTPGNHCLCFVMRWEGPLPF